MAGAEAPNARHESDGSMGKCGHKYERSQEKEIYPCMTCRSLESFEEAVMLLRGRRRSSRKLSCSMGQGQLAPRDRGPPSFQSP